MSLLFMQYIDSHCHLDFGDFDPDREQLLKRCMQADISDIIIPAVTVKRWQQLLTLCQSNDMLHPALGCHPQFMDEHPPDAADLLASAVAENRPVAIGEIGLDFYLPDSDEKAQIELFEAQLKVACEFQLPVILHVRKAHDSVLKRLRYYRPPGGIAHAFNGSQQQAEVYRSLGFKLGIGGMVTHSKARRIRRTFSELPLSQIVLETDAPDMPLDGQQGQRNSPEYIPVIAKTLATLRDEPLATIAAETTCNVRECFQL